MEYMTPDEVATLLRVAPRTLQTWRYRKQGPPYVIVSTLEIRYKRRDVEKWLRERTVAPA